MVKNNTYSKLGPLADRLPRASIQHDVHSTLQTLGLSRDGLRCIYIDNAREKLFGGNRHNIDENHDAYRKNNNTNVPICWLPSSGAIAESYSSPRRNHFLRRDYK